MVLIGECVAIRDLDDGWVPAGESFVLPRSYEAVVSESSDYPGLTIKLVVAVDNFGRTTCREITVRSTEGEPITPQTLRGLRLAELLRISARAAMEKVERSEDGTLRQAPMTAADLDAFYKRFTGSRQARQGSPLTDEQLRKVAELYRAAQAQGLPPVKAIQESMKVSRPTASRWVAAARKGKFLEERSKR